MERGGSAGCVPKRGLAAGIGERGFTNNLGLERSMVPEPVQENLNVCTRARARESLHPQVQPPPIGSDRGRAKPHASVLWPAFFLAGPRTCTLDLTPFFSVGHQKIGSNEEGEQRPP